MPDPQWLEEESLTEAQLWEKRCREQLKRAQEAEAALSDAKRLADDLENKRVKAVGRTVDEAVRYFAKAKWPGCEATVIEPMAGADHGEWGVRFRLKHEDDAESWTSMKAWGIALPGGFGLTGWK